ncbi:MAG TPA: heme-dependent oxidative N-demethylase subunit alpha family protein [Ideonella sp.]|nr:heme-dependent oxidative N-demethylase subunit alpha family protein [Ideonella sp.]
MMGTFGCPSSFMAFDFQHAVSAPFRMQPGLRRLAPGAAQLSPSRPGSRHLHEKLAALTMAPHEVLLQQPGFDPAPALAALEEHACGEHPDALQAGVQGRLHARWLGWSIDAQGLAPQDDGGGAAEIGRCLQALPPAWRRAALLALAFAEDFAIVDGRSATIPWLAVALPSHWSPADKVGRHFAEVHAPVADNQLLITAGEHLMRLVTREERWERFVWNITRHPPLNNHPARLDPAPWPAALDADGIAALACFRTERQTFIPVPGALQAVFTIHVESEPLADAIAAPAEAALLHEALATMSPAVLAYRSLADVQQRLLAWLAARRA